MIKPKKYDWKDSNLALFGSDVEKGVKKDAANLEPAWKGSGRAQVCHAFITHFSSRVCYNAFTIMQYCHACRAACTSLSGPLRFDVIVVKTSIFIHFVSLKVNKLAWKFGGLSSSRSRSGPRTITANFSAETLTSSLTPTSKSQLICFLLVEI